MEDGEIFIKEIFRQPMNYFMTSFSNLFSYPGLANQLQAKSSLLSLLYGLLIYKSTLHFKWLKGKIIKAFFDM